MSDLQTAFTLLHDIVGNGHRAQRHAPMTSRGTAKYYTVHQPLTDDQIAAHLTGSATYAVPLIGTDTLASAGLIEQDAGGIDTARRILAAAEARGVIMFAIVVKGSGGHDGCHAWALYDGRYDPKAIRAQLHQIALDADASTDEIHPNNTNIRLPFGLHLRSHTRGRTLLQSGEVFENDTELDAAERAVLALPTNAAPPQVEIFPQVQPKIKGGNISTFNIARHQNGQIDTRAIGAAVRARFNAENDWSDLLSNAGGVETRDGWACACGHRHGHATQIAITSRDKIVSYSPNCDWAPHKDSGKALDKFGFYCDRKHNGKYMAAVEALARQYGLWVEPQRRRREDLPLPADTQYRTQAQAQDAQRKRDARKAEAVATLDAVRQRAAEDAELTKCDRAVLDTLLTIAGTRGWCRPSKARIAEMCEYSLGSVKRSLMILETRGYFTSEGVGGASNQTAIRTFVRGSFCAPDDPRIDLQRDLISDSGACERAPFPPACENVYADTLDAWQWSDDEHGADELSVLEPLAESANIQPEPVNFTDMPAESPKFEDLPPAEPVLDMGEIDRMVAEIQAVADARRDERHEPQSYWERHEARAWQESHPVAPEPPATVALAKDKAERDKDRTRAKWNAMRPGELDRELGVLRNYLISHPAARWPRWQIAELNQRLAAPPPDPAAYTPLPLDDLPLGVPEPGPAGILGTHWGARSQAPGRRPATAPAVRL